MPIPHFHKHLHHPYTTLKSSRVVGQRDRFCISGGYRITGILITVLILLNDCPGQSSCITTFCQRFQISGSAVRTVWGLRFRVCVAVIACQINRAVEIVVTVLPSFNSPGHQGIAVALEKVTS